jgi:hypothetical protein
MIYMVPDWTYLVLFTTLDVSMLRCVMPPVGIAVEAGMVKTRMMMQNINIV